VGAPVSLPEAQAAAVPTAPPSPAPTPPPPPKPVEPPPAVSVAPVAPHRQAAEPGVATMVERRCPVCGSPVSGQARFCRSCGADLTQPVSWPHEVPTKEAVVPARLSAAMPTMAPGPAARAALARRPTRGRRSVAAGLLIVAVMAGAVIGLTFVPSVRDLVPVLAGVRVSVLSVVQRIGNLIPGRAGGPAAPPARPEARVPPTPQMAVPPSSAPRASLRVTSKPPGAQVKVDGVLVGTTELVLKDVKSGNHVVVITRAGYQGVTREIQIEPGQTLILDVTLLPATQPSTDPRVVSVSLPSAIASDGKRIAGSVRFEAPGRNLRVARFEVVRAQDFAPFSFDPEVYGQAAGTFKFYVYCNTPQKVTLRLTLRDADGRESTPRQFSFSCRERGGAIQRPASPPPPPPPPPEPPPPPPPSP